MSSSETYIGKVIFFVKNYGFIAYTNPHTGAECADIFVHWSDINVSGFKTIKKDQNVTFQIGINIHGQPKAINVTPIAVER